MEYKVEATRRKHISRMNSATPFLVRVNVTHIDLHTCTKPYRYIDGKRYRILYCILYSIDRQMYTRTRARVHMFMYMFTFYFNIFPTGNYESWECVHTCVWCLLMHVYVVEPFMKYLTSLGTLMLLWYKWYSQCWIILPMLTYSRVIDICRLIFCHILNFFFIVNHFKNAVCIFFRVLLLKECIDLDFGKDFYRFKFRADRPTWSWPF